VSTINVSEVPCDCVSDTLRGHAAPAGLRARVQADQNPDLQLDALKATGCYLIFVDTASGTLDERLELAKVLDQLRPGDTLVVWKLDRLGRRDWRGRRGTGRVGRRRN
jgi:hypothetical protein